MKNAPTPEFHIHRINEVEPHSDGDKIVLRADTLLDNRRTELEIAVTTELAPAMALALLSTTAKARSGRDELDPALEALGAAVVRSSSSDNVRLQLLFDKGAVLPVELTIEAARALSKGLVEYIGSSRRRLAEGRVGSTSP
ncbi:MAG: hypothetical protein H7Y61_02115 [Rhizobiales bacterium]|nr:hypothetical protein [Rhizobacter sp.]